MADVLAMKGSPRAGGNTDLLLDEAVKGARNAGHNVTVLTLRDLQYSGCLNCGGCTRTGRCHVPDALQQIFPLLESNEHVILASPVFFMDVTWKLKAMIDRCQVYWARKHVLKAPSGRVRPGGNCSAILVGGTHFKRLFDAPTIVLKAWCATMDLKLRLGLTINGIDQAGEILKHPDALERAREIGRTIALPD